MMRQGNNRIALLYKIVAREGPFCHYLNLRIRPTTQQKAPLMPIVTHINCSVALAMHLRPMAWVEGATATIRFAARWSCYPIAFKWL